MVVDELAVAGGIEESLVTLTEAIRLSGCDSVVLSCRPFPPHNQYAVRLKANRVEITTLPWPLLSMREHRNTSQNLVVACFLLLGLPLSMAAILWQVVFSKRTLRRGFEGVVGRVRGAVHLEDILLRFWQAYLNRWSRRNRIDCVHVHGYGCGVVPRWVLNATAVLALPVIYTEHGVPWPDLKNHREVCQHLSRVSQIIAISKAAEAAIERFCSATAPIHVIHHVVPDPQPGGSAKRSAEVGKQALVFGCVGMLRREKGHVHWLQSMPTVLDLHPRLRFEIVGDGPERRNLEQEAKRLGIEDHVSFLGSMDHGAALERMMSWDAFVLPSLEEPLGIVVVEAMAAGLPIVATEAGGVMDLVSDNRSALLVPPGRSDRLAEAQLRLAGDIELRHSLGNNARQAYETGNFTALNIATSTHHLYCEAMTAHAEC